MDLYSALGISAEMVLLAAGLGIAAALLMAAYIGYRRRGSVRAGLPGLSDR
jgi:hypothetical protein